jgi:hypothetical protein
MLPYAELQGDGSAAGVPHDDETSASQLPQLPLTESRNDIGMEAYERSAPGFGCKVYSKFTTCFTSTKVQNTDAGFGWKLRATRSQAAT